MKLHWIVIGTASLLGSIWVGCSAEGQKQQAASSGGSGGGAGAVGTGGTGGIGPALTSYTPEGCGYEVSVPDVAEEATGHGSAVGSEPAPRHVHVSYAGPTTTTFAVNWKTDLDTQLSQVLYGTDQAAVEAADGAADGVRLQSGHTIRYGSTSPLHQGQMTRVHEAHVCGLTPDTTYFYKVGGPGHWSEVHDVATGPEIGSSAPWRFAAAGDSRTNPEIWAQVAEKIAGEAPELVVFTGDAVATGADQENWDDWFTASSGGFVVEQSLARIPYMMTNGNHENLALNYFAQFAFPQEVAAGEQNQGELWYSFDYANAHFVMLDSQLDATHDEQVDYLRADLGAVDRSVTPWVFVAFHHPMYSCSNHGSEKSQRAAWQPVFDEYQVDVVWMGHDHNYERSVPIRGLDADGEGIAAQADANGAPVNGSGTLYSVVGGAGAPLYGSGTCYHTQISEETRGYVVVDVDASTLTWRALRLDGSEIESFTFSK